MRALFTVLSSLFIQPFTTLHIHLPIRITGVSFVFPLFLFGCNGRMKHEPNKSKGQNKTHTQHGGWTGLFLLFLLSFVRFMLPFHFFSLHYKRTNERERKKINPEDNNVM